MNLFEHIPDELPEELIEVLAEGQDVRIERIVSSGHASPEGFWYDQDQHEWVMVLSGEAKLLIQETSGLKTVHLSPGDALLIPAHQKHRVEGTAAKEKTIWLAVFFSG